MILFAQLGHVLNVSVLRRIFSFMGELTSLHFYAIVLGNVHVVGECSCGQIICYTVSILDDDVEVRLTYWQEKRN